MLPHEDGPHDERNRSVHSICASSRRLHTLVGVCSPNSSCSCSVGDAVVAAVGDAVDAEVSAMLSALLSAAAALASRLGQAPITLTTLIRMLL